MQTEEKRGVSSMGGERGKNIQLYMRHEESLKVEKNLTKGDIRAQ
jgi:hypothetical protein